MSKQSWLQEVSDERLCELLRYADEIDKTGTLCSEEIWLIVDCQYKHKVGIQRLIAFSVDLWKEAAIRFAKSQEKGVWIEEPTYVPYCSECGAYSNDATGDVGFCSYCGRQMEKDAVKITPELLKYAKTFGKWKYESERGGARWRCDACNHIRINPIHYCPECKTDMELPL